MKTIILIRHAQAVEKRFGTSDMDRPLTPTGEKGAEKMARQLAEKRIHPDLIISSPADRAMDTAHIFAAAMGYDVHRIRIHSKLYEGIDAAAWKAIAPEIPDGTDTLVLVGHNPGLPKLAAFLVRGFSLPIPKAGYVQIRVTTASGWPETQPGSGAVVGYSFPGRKKRELKATQRQVQERIMNGLQEYIHLIGRESLPQLEKNAGKASRKLARIITKNAIRRSDALFATVPGKKAK